MGYPERAYRRRPTQGRPRTEASLEKPRDRVHTGHLTGLQLPRRHRLSPHKQPRTRRALEAHRT
eukprot:6156190-Ditylum_brightwellii.AAC.1